MSNIETPTLECAVVVRGDCTYCGQFKAQIVLAENRSGFLQPRQVGAICPHLELALAGYNQKAAIARGNEKA